MVLRQICRAIVVLVISQPKSRVKSCSYPTSSHMTSLTAIVLPLAVQSLDVMGRGTPRASFSVTGGKKA